MSKEGGKIIKFGLRTLGHLILISIMLPIINYDKTIVAFKLANDIDPKITCPTLPGPTLDIIFGAGTRKFPDGRYGPNIVEEGRLGAEASRIIKNPQMLKDTTIFLADGPLEDPDIDKLFLENEVREQSNGQINLPDNLIVSDPEGFNTTTGATNAVRYMNEHGILNATVITSKKHLDRAWFSLYVRDVCAKKIAAEDELQNGNLNGYKQLQMFNRTPPALKALEKEKKEMWLLIVDQYGMLPTALNWLSNPK